MYVYVCCYAMIKLSLHPKSENVVIIIIGTYESLTPSPFYSLPPPQHKPYEGRLQDLYKLYKNFSGSISLQQQDPKVY